MNNVPGSVAIESTILCQGGCTICANKYVQHYNQRPSVVDPVIVDKIINEIATWGTSIGLTWSHYGEPLLNKNLAEYISYAKTTIGKRVGQQALFTNGMLLTPVMFETLVNAGLNYCSVSVDGANAQTFEKRRPGLKYDVIVENIKACAALKVEKGFPCTLRTHFVAGEDNVAEKSEYHRIWTNYPGIDAVSALPDDGRATGKPFEDISKEEACSSPFSGMFILTSGECVICCQDIHASLVLGNVNEQSLEEIWNGDKYTMVREAHKAGHKRHVLEVCRACATRY